MSHYAILIDGGFAKRKLGSSNNPATANDFFNLIQEIQKHKHLQGLRLHRVYFYDAQPYLGTERNPLSDEQTAFGSTPLVTRSRQMFEQLAKLPFVALRLGELAFNGWTIKPKIFRRTTSSELNLSSADLQPIIQQKGVDMRIGIDIAALTLKKQAQVIVLVTGDSDFVPAMKFARREGAQLFLAPLGQKVYASMLEHSDIVLDIPATDATKNI